MTRYLWKPGARFSLDAQVVGERLEELRAAHGGVTAPVVVADARAEDSPLHPAFEWNDAEAAERYREEQARDLIRSVTLEVQVEPGQPPVTTRAFVHVDVNDEPRYTSFFVAMDDDEMRQQVIQRALAEAELWRAKYHDLRELATVFTAIDQARLALH